MTHIVGLVDEPRLPQLGVRRTLVVVAVAVCVALGARYLVLAVTAAQALAELEASPEGWGAVGTALLGAITALLLSLVLAVVAVAVGVRGHRRAPMFTVVFVLVLVAVLLVQSIGGVSGLGAVIAPRFGDRSWFALVFSAPFLWAIPAAAVGALRWRWLAAIAVAVAVGVACYALVGAASS